MMDNCLFHHIDDCQKCSKSLSFFIILLTDCAGERMVKTTLCEALDHKVLDEASANQKASLSLRFIPRDLI